MTTYTERVQTYHEKKSWVNVEYNSEYSENLERMLYVHVAGYGKPSIVDTITSDYIKSRRDLDVYFSFEGESFRDLPERKGFMGTPQYRLIKNYTYFTLKDEKMEDLLCYYGEVMDARRQNLSWIKNGGK